MQAGQPTIRVLKAAQVGGSSDAAARASAQGSAAAAQAQSAAGAGWHIPQTSGSADEHGVRSVGQVGQSRETPGLQTRGEMRGVQPIRQAGQPQQQPLQAGGPLRLQTADQAAGPRSLVSPSPEDVMLTEMGSSVTILAYQAAETMSQNFAAAHRKDVDEAMHTITTRVEEALHSLKMELPQLWQETSSVRDAFESKVKQLESRLAEEVEARTSVERSLQENYESHKYDLSRLQDIQAMCGNRIERLENRLQDEMERRKVWEQGVAEAMRGAEEKSLASQADLVSQLKKLQGSIAEEANNRQDSQRVLAKDIRESVASEVDRIREQVMREMRERMDGQQTLREEMQVLQQALTRLTPRVEEALIELRTDLPRLSQECSSQRTRIDKTASEQAAAEMQLQKLEKTLKQESTAREEAYKALDKELHDIFASESKRVSKQLNEQQSTLKDLSVSSDIYQRSIKALEQSCSQLGQDAGQAKDTMERLTSQLQVWSDQTERQATDFERKVSGVKNWVDTACVQRLTALDRALRQEMSERASAVQQVSETASRNSEMCCHLQAKYDDLLTDFEKAQASSLS
mmetsp:Transcript_60406/g.144007  ORF Transcript_60406/g.144007 Transcript_60406/m.144007 type:complete len:575 (-) Transcript_60406:114-1838(-)